MRPEQLLVACEGLGCLLDPEDVLYVWEGLMETHRTGVVDAGYPTGFRLRK